MRLESSFKIVLVATSLMSLFSCSPFGFPPRIDKASWEEQWHEYLKLQRDSLITEFIELSPEARLLLIDEQEYLRNRAPCVFDAYEGGPFDLLSAQIMAEVVFRETGIGDSIILFESKAYDYHELCWHLLDWSCNYSLELGPEDFKVCGSKEMISKNLGNIYSSIDSLRESFRKLTPLEKLKRVNCQRDIELSYGNVFDQLCLPFDEMVEIIADETDVMNGTLYFGKFGLDVSYTYRKFQKELELWADSYGLDSAVPLQYGE